MTDQEFDILDELYFVKSFTALKDDLDVKTESLKEVLGLLIDKSWVGCYATPMVGLPVEKVNFEENYLEYFYLATKKGMFEHNSLW